jgi:hypothetical protein
VGGGVAFTTSSAMACWASGADGPFVATYLSRADHAPPRPRCGVGAHVCLTQSRPAPLGRAVAAHDNGPEGSRLRDTHRQVTLGVIASPLLWELPGPGPRESVYTTRH